MLRPVLRYPTPFIVYCCISHTIDQRIKLLLKVYSDLSVSRLSFSNRVQSEPISGYHGLPHLVPAWNSTQSLRTVFYWVIATPPTSHDPHRTFSHNAPSEQRHTIPQQSPKTSLREVEKAIPDGENPLALLLSFSCAYIYS